MNITCEPIACPSAPPHVLFALLTGSPGGDRRALRGATREHLRALASQLVPDGGSLRETPTGPAGCGTWSGIGFSISYARNHALVGVALNRALGVDLVDESPVPEWREMAALYFSPEAFARLQSTPPDQQLAEFRQAWCALEADLKCTGAALTEHWTIHATINGLRRLRPQVPSGFHAAASVRAWHRQ